MSGHHLVYTYDWHHDARLRDGVLQNSEVLGPGAINTTAGNGHQLATQLEADGATPTAALRGSLSLARVRIHDGVLTDAQIATNYTVELPDFLAPVPVPLAAGPTHLYSFNSAPVSDAAGTSIRMPSGPPLARCGERAQPPPARAWPWPAALRAPPPMAICPTGCSPR
jgi:hypothetical protein